jgi:myo-inositol-1(or 4)-monophosphatase
MHVRGAAIDDLEGVAIEAARRAGRVHRRWRDGPLSPQTKSSALDLVTEVDREAERELVQTIRAARPQDAVRGEEGAQLEGSSGLTWVVDPLDGTTNFVHGYPAHAVAVGVLRGSERLLGVVLDTVRDELWVGGAGRAPTRDECAVAVAPPRPLGEALVITGFLPDRETRERQVRVLRHVLPRVRDIRRSGCPALDLCAVASGRADATFECGLGPWDIAAGAAIVEAAGGFVSTEDVPGLPSPLLVAGSGKLLAGELSAIVQEAARQLERDHEDQRRDRSRTAPA